MKTIFFACVVLCAAVACCAAEQTVTVNYRVTFKDKDAGTFDSSRSLVESGKDGAVRVTASYSVDVRFLFIRYRLESTETAVIKDDEMVSYSCDMTENGKRRKIEAKPAGDVIALEVTEDGDRKVTRVRRDLFDSTTMHTPESLVSKEKPVKTVRVLDPMDGIVRKYDVKYAGSQEVAIGKKIFKCSMVQFKGPTESGTRWVAVDDVGPFVIKEDARDKDGPYSLVPVSYEEKNGG